ncbi:MAG: hypothetical protein EBS84_22890 [Proteobacteria bacterium]|nr:hypothetical protein [Pseudomonadota bacterium]
MVAGEASGDLLAGRLIEGMQARWTTLEVCGIGGPQMVGRGMQAWWPQDKLAVHGFSWELIRRYREIVGIRRQLRERHEGRATGSHVALPAARLEAGGAVTALRRGGGVAGPCGQRTPYDRRSRRWPDDDGSHAVHAEQRPAVPGSRAARRRDGLERVRQRPARAPDEAGGQAAVAVGTIRW